MIKTDLPQHYGENQFAERITKLLEGDDYWYWFNVQIPRSGMSKEVDVLIYSKTHKLFFVVEVKGFHINQIENIYKGKLTLSNGDERGNPWSQAADNAKKFRSVMDYLIREKHLNINKRVYFSPMVSLPLINRNDFEVNFTDSSKSSLYLKEMLKSTLFSNDFENENTLLSRIKTILENPIYSMSFMEYIRDSPLNNNELNNFSSILFPKLRGKYNPAYDPKFLKEIEKECLRILNIIQSTHPILIEGYAGTGKTFIGFNLARKLASQGKKILFTCYNKTLATDLKRIKNNEPVFRNYPKVRDNLFIKDIFEILSELNKIFPNTDNIMTTYSEKRNLERDTTEKFELKSKIEQIDKSNSKTDYDVWAESIINKVLISEKMNKHLILYDYIIADETQDFKEYMFDLLELLVKENNKIAFIFGKKQVLYVNDESFDYVGVKDIRDKLIREEKRNYIERRRVFRTTDLSFLIAQSYLECFPKSSDAIEFIDNNYKRKDEKNLAFEFAREGGHLPKLIFSDGKIKNLKFHLKKTLGEIFERNKRYNGFDSDLMILIPHYKYIKTPIIDCLINDFGKKFIDYTLDLNKRIEFSEDEVRICSYYSARGLEANFVLIIGFNYFEIPIIERKKEYIINDLGYIVLSRAIYDTYLLCITETKERQIEFLEKIINYYK